MTRITPLTRDHFPESDLTEALVLDSSVAGLGDIELVDSRTTGKGTTDQPFRHHKFFTLELDGYKQAVEVTDPVNNDPAYVIASSPGLTEHIRGGIRQKMHSHTSYAHPNARIVSIESDGIGSVGDRYSWSEKSLHNLDSMGVQRQKVARALAAKLPVFLHGTSMGTVINHRIAEYNLQLPEHDQLNLQGMVWLSPALVKPSRTPLDMALRFPTGLARSFGKKLLWQSGDFFDMAGSAVQHDFEKEDLLALGHQVADLLRGTSEDRIANVIKQIPTVIVAGKQDSLTQFVMFKRIASDIKKDQGYDIPLLIKVLPGKGHELGAIPRKACRKMKKESQHLVDALLQPEKLVS